MQALEIMVVVTAVVIVALPKMQTYMRMLVEEHDEMEKLS